MGLDDLDMSLKILSISGSIS